MSAVFSGIISKPTSLLALNKDFLTVIYAIDFHVRINMNNKVE
jgi:hypothetical protein